MGGPSPGNGQQGSPSRRGRARGRHSRGGAAVSADPGQPGPVDLAAVARDAVVAFLRDQSAGEAGAGPGQLATLDAGAEPLSAAAGATSAEVIAAQAAPGGAQAEAGISAAGEAGVQSAALRATGAAALSVATLDRIEAVAARLEADIAVARREQAELQARAGAAAAAAVRAAQESEVSAERRT